MRCPFCDQDLHKKGGICLPSIKVFTMANITAQEANSKAMHALQKTLNNEAEITVPTYVQQPPFPST